MQTTSATWKALWASGKAWLETRAVIAQSVYTQMSNPVIVRALTQQGPGVGNAVSATCQFAILTDDALPRAAAVRLEMRLTDGGTVSEWLPAGTFYISHRTRDAVTGVLTLECYDALLKANGEMPSAGVTWPRAMADVAADVAQLLGVALDSRTTIKTGVAYMIEAPEPGTTIHDVLGRIAAANGGNWVITPAGDLRLVPVISASGAASATQDVVDVVGVTGAVTVHTSGAVTGVRYPVDGEYVVLGDETGIVLEADVGAAIANDLYDDLRGTTYQAYDLNGAIYDPAAELGDYVRGGANGEVRSVLCSETATLALAFRGDISAPEADELSDEYPYIGGNQKVLTAAKVYAAQRVEALDDSLTQQEVFNRLTGSGAAQGIYLVDGQLYVNASYIHSGALRLGGVNNVNGTFELLDASGNVIIRGSNAGFSLTNLGEIFSTRVGQYFEYYSRLGDGRIDLMAGNNYRARVGYLDDLPDPAVRINCRESGGGLSIEGPDFQHQGATNYPFISLEPNGSIVIRYHDLQLLPYFSDSSLYLSQPLGIGNGGTGATTAAGARTALGAVAKAGDTMTGDLQFTSNITPSTTPGSTTSASRVACLDADGNVISILRTTHTNGGAIEAKVIARRIISGNTVLNELGPTINADGSLGYKVTNAEAFRTAAGAFAAANVYNGLDKTASGFALDARQGKALDDAMTMIGNGAFNLGTIAAGTSKVLQCSLSSHAMLILTGPSIDLMGLYLIRIGANDVPNTVTVTQGSKITFTPATGKITIGNTSTGSMAVNVIPLSRNSSYFSLT